MNETEQKLQTLSRVAEALNAKHIRWALGGGAMLYLAGLGDEDFRGITILTVSADARGAEEALSAFAEEKTEEKERPVQAQFFREFTADGTEIDLIAGLILQKGSTEYCFPLEKEAITGTAYLGEVPVPLHSAACWAQYYTLMGREAVASQITRRLPCAAEKAILRCLTLRWKPKAVIVYGSRADGSAAEGSDFDALLLTDGAEGTDTRVYLGVPLDVTLLSAPHAAALSDAECARYSGGRLALDTDGCGAALLERIRNFTSSLPGQTELEKQSAFDRCRKMAEDAGRAGPAGDYFRHLLLTESLKTWFDLRGFYYPGVKKALRDLARKDPENAETYFRALKNADPGSLKHWMKCLENALRLPVEKPAPKRRAARKKTGKTAPSGADDSPALLPKE